MSKKKGCAPKLLDYQGFVAFLFVMGALLLKRTRR
jgi:hypothetical protein